MRSNSEITPDELEALRQLVEASARTRIHSSHASRLVELGYAREAADGIAVTARGRGLAAAGDVLLLRPRHKR